MEFLNEMRLAEILFFSLVIGGFFGAVFIIRSYMKGLQGMPREMWFLFTSKVLEYTAYAAINMSITLWLTRDCGLSDVVTGTYIMAWSLMLSVMNILAGALADTFGLKKIMIFSAVLLIFSRIIMAFFTNPILIFALGFIPLAMGFAIVMPVISIAIKRYTTKEQAAMGFGLFYVIMNIAFAIGGWYFDKVRDVFALKDAAGKIIDENAGTIIMGTHFSTYQLFFLFGVLFTALSLVAILFLREGVDKNEDGSITITPLKKFGSGLEAIKSAASDIGGKLKSAIGEKYFWIFLGMISTTLFVRFIFFHFHYTFPKYGIRILGEGAKIGQVYGVLNPVFVVFLTPLIAYLTKKVSSYKMLIVGSTISAFSCFIAVIPSDVFAHLTNSVLGEMVFVNWLGLAENHEALAAMVSNHHIAAYWPLIFFIGVFTIGEAIWSPRMMQFTVEIAPKGKEGTYLGLAILPWFLAKFVVGPMSGIVLNAYTPLNEAGKAMDFYPDHGKIWLWIGGMALLTPLSLLIFRKIFTHGVPGPDEETPEPETA
ncbi:MFS transporter [bacterium]|nr:MFS transporter [bacterium]